MIEIDDKIVSEDLFDEFFCCDLDKCNGECCVQGDAGAPLEEEEIGLLEDCFDVYKRYMTPAGLAAVERQGVFAVDFDGDYTTTLVAGSEECAFSFNENGYTLCAVERAWMNGEIAFRKPLSCHLYPIRVARFRNGSTGLNYHRWSVCRAACVKGRKEGIKVYQSLKDPIERAFGKEFYRQLAFADELLSSGKGCGEE